MKIATMFSDVIGSLWKKPATVQYPFERVEAPVRLRGKLEWDPDKCTGCNLCSKDCPADAIEIITIDKKAKRFVMQYHIDRCTYCAQCVESCRFSCIEMTDDQWELAATNKVPFEVSYGREEDLAEAMAKFALANTVETE